MNPNPPWLFTLTLLLWSWQSGAWLPGLALAAWFEWTMRTRSRWRLADRHLERLVDLTSLLVLALVLFEYSRGPLSAGIFATLRWSPVLLAPLLSAQLLSARAGVSYRALFLSQRRSRSPEADRVLDLTPIYLAACVLAAGVGTSAGGGASHPLGYLGGVLVLTLWVSAWQPRARPRRQWPLWLALLILAGALAWVGQQGVTQAQRRVEELAVNWMSGLLWSERDPYQARTALGEIGELKLSDRVLYRVTTDAPLRQALLLRTASYDRYAGATWFTHERAFTPVSMVGGDWLWMSAERAPTAPGAESGGADQRVRIGGYLPRRGQLLPLPSGAWRLRDLPVDSLERQSLGAVKAKDGPPLIRYQAFFTASARHDRPPQDTDLRVPKPEVPVLQALAAELGLNAQNTAETIRRVRAHFAQDFRYSLRLPGAPSGRTEIGHFLTSTQAGHCEFFASATVLLLRQAGIPARYAVGYSVQEADAAPNSYRVRRSHAHAWTLYWDSGHWHDFDTTPALWAALEASERPVWQPLADLWSRLWYEVNLSRLEPGQGTPLWLWGVLGLLFALLAYRLRLGQRWTAARTRRRDRRAAAPDSPLAPIATALTRAGWPRRPGETERQWLTRLKHSQAGARELPASEPLLHLHEKSRYRPGGLAASERTRLEAEIAAWLAAWKAS
ncbi:Protein-glutamine gamma-glutamyltransferase [Thiorhodovibrio winogradskyi]|uniref:Protein-glutamine gamma-glutamyltransferase n=1 Tax=Thiorhodovibrio winogradskyi TaxID=77007 RepID=A0ABZ0SE49_9GAMM|nr:transglutaminase domain-containing protein [Thiorhodovibrio winogradskyi]